MTYPFRTLLACWLAVAATGTVVSHRHEGAPGHTHGWGWLTTPSVPAGALLSHRHIVLLGIESGAIPDAPDSESSDAPAQVVPAFDASFPVEPGSGDPSDGPSVPALVVAFDAPAPVPSAGGVSALTCSVRPADHTRSAVLRL